jgi:hypothetical protein
MIMTHRSILAIALVAGGIILAAGPATPVGAEEEGATQSACLDPEAVVGARYRIREERIADAASEGDGRVDYAFTLLRPTPSRLIYDMPATQLTQVYERYGNGRIKLLEYFHAERIGVEHEPADPMPGRAWPAMFELIDADTVAALDPGKEETAYRCLGVETRAGNDAGADVYVEYVTQLRLPLFLRRTRDGVVKSWQLEGVITDESAPRRILDTLNGYRLYDFADLGDSEHEEFFRSSRYLTYKLGHRH